MKLDLRNAYNLVRIRQDDEWKMAFNTTTSGHYEYCAMPYALSCTPLVFHCLIHDVLRDFLCKFVIEYIDEILIYSHSLETHVAHVRKVLPCLLDNQQFVKGENCEVHVLEISFLGFIVSQESATVDEAKVTAVAEWPVLEQSRTCNASLALPIFTGGSLGASALLLHPHDPPQEGSQMPGLERHS